MAQSTVTACLVIIGNEILSGRTQDANLAFLAEGLNDVGIRMREARVIPDIEATIIATVNEMRAKYDYVFTTGGIGPTHDDITSPSIAKAFGVPLLRNAEVVAALADYYAQTGRAVQGGLNEARLRMADFPEGAVLVKNPMTRAPGYYIGNVYVFAGVPSIMRAMFEAVKPTLRGGRKMHSRALTAALSEGAMAADLARIQDLYADVEIGSYPFFDHQRYGVSIVLRGHEPTRVEAATEDVRQMMRALGSDPVDGEAA
ncbi:MAG: molybdopterin-binding protein [Alphaproteobacteria bacterium]